MDNDENMCVCFTSLSTIVQSYHVLVGAVVVELCLLHEKTTKRPHRPSFGVIFILFYNYSSQDHQVCGMWYMVCGMWYVVVRSDVVVRVLVSQSRSRLWVQSLIVPRVLSSCLYHAITTPPPKIKIKGKSLLFIWKLLISNVKWNISLINLNYSIIIFTYFTFVCTCVHVINVIFHFTGQNKASRIPLLIETCL